MTGPIRPKYVGPLLELSGRSNDRVTAMANVGYWPRADLRWLLPIVRPAYMGRYSAAFARGARGAGSASIRSTG